MSQAMLSFQLLFAITCHKNCYEVILCIDNLRGNDGLGVYFQEMFYFSVSSLITIASHILIFGNFIMKYLFSLSQF